MNNKLKGFGAKLSLPNRGSIPAHSWVAWRMASSLGYPLTGQKFKLGNLPAASPDRCNNIIRSCFALSPLSS